MSTIFVRNLIVSGIHGVNAKEQEREQPFRIAIELEADTAKAEKSDDLADTINYKEVKDIAESVVRGPSFFLLEALANRIAEKILENPRILSVQVSIEKMKIWDNGVPGVVIKKQRS
ncbi:MAG: dihydroneopterin aldolase [Parcubacteria group bacterium]|nr:dihydroneopterin aldolase [Parcubacteria group bacterium]